MLTAPRTVTSYSGNSSRGLDAVGGDQLGYLGGGFPFLVPRRMREDRLIVQ